MNEHFYSLRDIVNVHNDIFTDNIQLLQVDC